MPTISSTRNKTLTPVGAGAKAEAEAAKARTAAAEIFMVMMGLKIYTKELQGDDESFVDDDYARRSCGERRYVSGSPQKVKLNPWIAIQTTKFRCKFKI